MHQFPQGVYFRKQWRSYQSRVLHELEAHLGDNHLHVVAAPGSGKTVLGLEVALRLNQPTLIFAPTVAIRDQWIDRLVDLFCEAGTTTPDWVSKDVRSPAFLTVTTYQGLFSAMKGKTEDKSASARLLKTLKEVSIGTLILDEAHHLRNTWWSCLIQVKDSLTTPTVVSLTATAPFDVAPQEWDKYVDLCGPIDAEIVIPELVKQETLCPHQDLVFVSTPLASELNEIETLRQALSYYLQTLYQDAALIDALAGHPHVADSQRHKSAILAHPEFYTAVAVFLKKVSKKQSPDLLRTLGLSAKALPNSSADWMERLLNGLLFERAKSVALPDGVRRRIHRDLSRLGALEKRRVTIEHPQRIAHRLVRSVSKLTSVESIVALEQEVMGDTLRMVILTDYIRREDFPRHGDDVQSLKRLGVVPIFEQLRRRSPEGVRLGILSGSLVVIPKASLPLLQETAREMAVALSALRTRPLKHDDAYLEVKLRGVEETRLVHLLTALFSRGGVTVLVGTTALLGEGWDAPSVNALILASVVGSYMLSNQMRGRAIRRQEGNPDKTANIWHLVCQEPERAESGPDLELLIRRFQAFSGPSFNETSIQNGIERLGMGHPPFSGKRIAKINATMEAHARARDQMAAHWQAALAAADQEAMVESLLAYEDTAVRRFVLKNALRALVWQICFGGLAGGCYTLWTLRGEAMGVLSKVSVWGLMLAAMALALWALPWCVNVWWRGFWHLPKASSVKQAGKAVYKALVRAELIQGPYRPGMIVSHRQTLDLVCCMLQGVSTRERSLFLDGMEQVLGPIEDGRYVLLRRSPLRLYFIRDSFLVPSEFAKNKAPAEAFCRDWSRFVGPVELHYTRHEKGRAMLIKAKTHSLYTLEGRITRRVRSWT